MVNVQSDESTITSRPIDFDPSLTAGPNASSRRTPWAWPRRTTLRLFDLDRTQERRQPLRTAALLLVRSGAGQAFAESAPGRFPHRLLCRRAPKQPGAGIVEPNAAVPTRCRRAGLEQRQKWGRPLGRWHQIQQPVEHPIGTFAPGVEPQHGGVDGRALPHADNELEQPAVNFTVRHQQRDDEVRIREARGGRALRNLRAHSPQIPTHVRLFDEPISELPLARKALQPLSKERPVGRVAAQASKGGGAVHEARA